MDCFKCHENLDTYLVGKISDEMKLHMKTHIEECEDCHEIYTIRLLTEKVIAEENSKNVNPFMASRVMAKIESFETENEKNVEVSLNRISLRPVFIAVVAVIALFLGIAAGISYNKTLYSERAPGELVYMNDAALESLYYLTNE